MNFAVLSKYRKEIMGFACIWVMLHHNMCDWPDGTALAERFCLVGNMGVDIFLFLSGIGLFFSLSKKPPLKGWYKKRFSRILIPYLIICVPYYLWFDFIAGKGNFLLDITQLSFPLSHRITTWYAPAIIVFYLLAPFIVRLAAKQENLYILNTVLMAAAAVFFCYSLQFVFPAFYNNTEIALNRLCIFILGLAAGKAVKEKQRVGLPLLILGIAVAAFYAFTIARDISLSAFEIRLLYGPCAIAVCLILSFILSKINFGPLNKTLGFFGSYSFEIYLSHVLIRNVYYHYFPNNLIDPRGFVDYALILLVSVGFAVLVGKFTERIKKSEK